jgi:hypothetical protein
MLMLHEVLPAPLSRRRFLLNKDAEIGLGNLQKKLMA